MKTTMMSLSHCMMDNINRFRNYELFDFVFDDDFRGWTLLPSADTDLFWIDWINSNPNKEDLVNNAKEIILSLKVSEPILTDLQIDLIVEDTIAKLNAGLIEPSVEIKSKKYIYWLSGIAASFTIIFLAVFLNAKFHQSIYQQLVANSSAILKEKYNNSGKPLVIKLDDGSYITLQNHSRLSFPATFNKKDTRTVYLNGNAAFAIAKNPMKPFFVYANGIVTKVLGTKFTINSFDTEKKAVVEVTSGIVAVNSFNLQNNQPQISNKRENAVVLTRNQKVVYNSTNRQMQGSLNENPQLLVTASKFNFMGASVNQVFNAIEAGYGIEVIYDDKMLNNKKLTADLGNTTMFQKLDVICKILNCRYEIIDRKIYINNNTNN
jgi:transmembrane sensor